MNDKLDPNNELKLDAAAKLDAAIDRQDVVLSDSLITGVYSPLTLNQMRLLIVVLIQIRAKGKISHEDMFEVTAGGYDDLIDNSKPENYKALRRAAQELRAMFVTLTHAPDGEPLDETLTEINVVAKCEYMKGRGRVRLWFTPWIIPYISSLEKRFTMLDPKILLMLRSPNSIRLYELFYQWVTTPRRGKTSEFEDVRIFEVHEFRQLLGFTNGKKERYKRLDRLKDCVIMPAIYNINLFSDLLVEFGQNKYGKEVTHFVFTIKFKIRDKKGGIKPLTDAARKKYLPDKKTVDQMELERKQMINFCNVIENYEGVAAANRHRQRYNIPHKGNTPQTSEADVGGSGEAKTAVKGPPGDQEALPFVGDTPQTPEADVVVRKTRRRRKKAAAVVDDDAPAKPKRGKGAAGTKTANAKKTGKKVAAKKVGKKVATKKTPSRGRVAKKRQKK